MARTRITIGGVTDEEQAVGAAEAGADAVGFLFARGRPGSIDPADAYEIMGVLPPLVASVGEFIDPTLDEFSDIEEQCPTIYSQLSGAEDVPLVRSCGPDVLKVVRYDAATIARELALWDEVDEVCAIVIEVGVEVGAAGFDWSLLTPHLEHVRRPVMLAGALTPRNVAEAVVAVRPYGVIAGAGVEREGVKDVGLIEEFCAAVMGADRE
jgi:phosphoribosylanthranilate isomerase